MSLAYHFLRPFFELEALKGCRSLLLALLVGLALIPLATAFFFDNGRSPKALDFLSRFRQSRVYAERINPMAGPNEARVYLNATSPAPFKFILPPERLGKKCQSHEDFLQFLRKDRHLQSSQYPNMSDQNQTKHYTLIIIAEPNKKRILLGHKNRGFGKGFYNSFGGKVEPSDASVAHSAQREVLEETNLTVPLEALYKVGTLCFAFQELDMPTMIVHVFQLMVSTTQEAGEHPHGNLESNETPKMTTYHGRLMVPINASQISCHDDEITPQWFDDWHDIPLNKMFADDSIWLTHLLMKSDTTKQLDGWFYFQAGGAQVNTIMHWYLDVNPPSSDD